jgi:diguanylate cyclase (GGDEF)-like protein
MQEGRVKSIGDISPARLRTWVLAGGFLLVGLVGVIDYVTGFFMSFSIFYLAPIVIVTWYGGRNLGYATACASAAAWLLADLTAGHSYPSVAYPIWNATMRLGFFAIIVTALARRERSLVSEKALARTDALTGIRNRRAFCELAEKEMSRSRRYGHVFSVAYIDCDNFKAVNDIHGHDTGDALLQLAAQAIQDNVRTMDLVARLGGDEFALLMPETDEESAHEVVSRLRTVLLELMRKNEWPVTFSVGIVTFHMPPDNVEDLIRKADSVMYSAKNRGKNRIAVQVSP